MLLFNCYMKQGVTYVSIIKPVSTDINGVGKIIGTLVSTTQNNSTTVFLTAASTIVIKMNQ